jgi:hypothetical protein
MVKADVKAREMVIALEKSLGNQIFKVPRGAGFDVLVKSNGDEKHIEAKGIERDDTFFAINGLAGVRNLLFDDKYYVYFCDVTNDMVLITTKDFVFRNMGWRESEDIKRLIRSWTDTADAIRGISKIMVDGRIRFTLRHPIRKLVQDLRSNPSSIDASLRNTIVSLWKLKKDGWQNLYS